jgi:hypothetical protein
MPMGRLSIPVTTNPPAASIVIVRCRPPHVSSQTTHNRDACGSHCNSMTALMPLLMAATRVKAPESCRT